MAEFMETDKTIFEGPLRFKVLVNDGMMIAYPHWHKAIEIIYSVKGTLNLGVNDEVIQLNEGEIFILGSGDIHYFLASPGSIRYVYMFDLALFKNEELYENEISLNSLFERCEGHSKKWPESLQRKVYPLLKGMHENFFSEKKGSKHKVVGELYEMIGEFYELIPLTREAHSNTLSEIQYKDVISRLNEVFAYVEQNYTKKIQLKDVASQAGFSQYYFTRFFKKNTGQTFTDFLLEYRITRAKFILASEKVTIAELAEKVGFGSVKRLHHAFKESVGMSPIKYQKSILAD